MNPLDKCLIVEDALSPDDFALCAQLIKMGENKLEEYNVNQGPKHKRWYPEGNTDIPIIISKLLWGERVMNKVANKDDLAWKLFVGKRAGNFELGVTYYDKPEHSYLWHVDHLDKAPEVNKPRVLNYILYMTKVEGGELLLSDDYGVTELCSATKEYNVGATVEPDVNKLVIMPSWIPHKVNPVTHGKRITINGHVTL